jgi:methionyl-tRNA formyltransferase
MKLVYYGTPQFAVEPLRVLLEKNFVPAAVVTAPDKPAGRGLKTTSSEVKQFALEKGLKILQPEKLSDENFISELNAISPDLQVIVAFRKLPEAVWRLSKSGTINLHASLLPDYRGAAPINHVIINGEKETGVTTFFINDKIDTGKIILQEKVPINEDDTAGTLHDKLMKKGAALLLETVRQIEKDSMQIIEQHNLMSNYEILHDAPKLSKEFCRISWNESPEKIYNFIRGLSPVPSAWTEITDENSATRLNIFSSEKELLHHNFTPGKIESDQKSFLKVAVPGGFVHLKELQLAGKKRLQVEEFLRGFNINTETNFFK